MPKTANRISYLIDSQLPDFINEEYELFGKFIQKYYEQLELQGQPYDIVENLETYRDIDFYENNLLNQSTTVTGLVNAGDTTITVADASSFPKNGGYIKIGDEVCFYKSRTDTQFLEISRGVSGTTKLGDLYSFSTFVTTQASSHTNGSTVLNISNLFLYALIKNFETEFLNDFPEAYLNDAVDKRTLIKNIGSFYQSKGTDESFRILFAALYGEVAEVVKPKDFLFRPSDAQFRKTRDLVVEKIQGDPLKLKNQTLYQSAYPEYGIDEAFATIIDVEKLTYNSKDYYQVSVDFDYPKDIDLTGGTLLGEFHAHPKTKNLSVVAAGASIIDVDSTIGFPTSGLIRVTGQSGILTYRSKTINQFIGVGAANTTTFGTTVEISGATVLVLL